MPPLVIADAKSASLLRGGAACALVDAALKHYFALGVIAARTRGYVAGDGFPAYAMRRAGFSNLKLRRRACDDEAILWVSATKCRRPKKSLLPVHNVALQNLYSASAEYASASINSRARISAKMAPQFL